MKKGCIFVYLILIVVFAYAVLAPEVVPPEVTIGDIQPDEKIGNLVLIDKIFRENQYVFIYKNIEEKYINPVTGLEEEYDIRIGFFDKKAEIIAKQDFEHQCSESSILFVEGRELKKCGSGVSLQYVMYYKNFFIINQASVFEENLINQESYTEQIFANVISKINSLEQSKSTATQEIEAETPICKPPISWGGWRMVV